MPPQPMNSDASNGMLNCTIDSSYAFFICRTRDSVGAAYIFFSRDPSCAWKVETCLYVRQNYHCHFSSPRMDLNWRYPHVDNGDEGARPFKDPHIAIRFLQTGHCAIWDLWEESHEDSIITYFVRKNKPNKNASIGSRSTVPTRVSLSLCCFPQEICFLWASPTQVSL